ncbi:MAG: hypothetical protein ACR2J7_08390 [Luteimonas sp.]
MNHALANSVAAALLGALALTGCKKDEPAAPPPAASEPTTMPSATPAPSATSPVSVTTVDLGNAVDSSQRVTTPMTAFSPGDTIYASVATRAADTSAPARGTLAARWTYQDGQVVDELSQDFAFTGSGNTVFQIGNPDGWPTGTYKVEIMLDGNVVQTRQFEVR